MVTPVAMEPTLGYHPYSCLLYTSRFCKRIELKGFHHLKISLARELVDAKDDGEISGHISCLLYTSRCV